MVGKLWLKVALASDVLYKAVQPLKDKNVIMILSLTIGRNADLFNVLTLAFSQRCVFRGEV